MATKKKKSAPIVRKPRGVYTDDVTIVARVKGERVIDAQESTHRDPLKAILAMARADGNLR